MKRVAALSALVICLCATPAWGSAEVKRSAPGNGAGLTRAPDEVWIEFTEPPAEGPRLRVTDSCGTPVGTGPPVVAGSRVTLPIEAIAKGEYVVGFSVQSSVDGETTKGTLTFAVARGDACSEPDSNGSEPNAAAPKRNDSNEATTSTVLFALGLAAAIGAGGGIVLRALSR